MAPALVREGRDAELGSTAEHFAEFDDEPMAPASIGQVHRAVLRDGRQVAVKLQYLGVAQAIRDDLANTELVATFVRFATSASGMVFDPRTRSHPFIRIPDVLPAACSDRILTMTYLDGMDWAAAQQADQDLKSTWAEVTTRFSNGNIRHANLLHADPIPVTTASTPTAPWVSWTSGASRSFPNGCADCGSPSRAPRLTVAATTCATSRCRPASLPPDPSDG
jgi:predicted unusual protein kinase regulating ubiquinone biosynthesis (AarF/ABC1/UbiB family)